MSGTVSGLLSCFKTLVVISILGLPWSTAEQADAQMRPIGHGGLIAFQGQLLGGFWDDTSSIYTVDPEGTELDKLFEDQDRPAWSPDGTRLAFEGVGIDVGDAEGTYFEPVTGEPLDLDPAWSPDGTRIAFSRWMFNTDDEIFMVNADGTGTRQVTSNERPDGSPSWSPDGRRIAFVTWDDQGDGDIFVIDLEDGSVIQLTHTGRINEGNPAFSPDGQKIAFDSGTVGSRQIYVMDADGSNVR